MSYAVLAINNVTTEDIITFEREPLYLWLDGLTL